MSVLEVDELISRVYDVALKTCEWPEFLAAMGEFCRAHSVALVLVSADNPPQVLGEWSATAPLPAAQRSPGTILHLSETLQLLLAHTDPSPKDIQAQLEPLLPHIRRVAGIQKELEATAGIGEATAMAFADRISTAVLIYDRQTRALLHSNPASERLLGQPDEKDGMAATSQIQRVMHRLLPGNPKDPMPARIRFDWSLRGVSLVGVAAPLSRENSKVATSDLDRLVLIFLHDPNRPPALQSEHLRARYGLTPKESRLALGVAYGGTLTSLSEDFRVSAQTLKSQMKSILKKVGVQSQAQMTAVLLQDDMLLFAGESA